MNRFRERYLKWRLDRAAVKTLKKYVKIRVAVNSDSKLFNGRLDDAFVLTLALIWGFGAFKPGIDGPERASFVFLGLYILMSGLNARRDRLAKVRLGELLVKYHRESGEKDPDPLDQILAGDATVAVRVHSTPDSHRSWRTISWIETPVAKEPRESKVAP